MALKTHHKILIGGFTTIVVIYMIINGFFVYLLILKTTQIEIRQIEIAKNLTTQIKNTRSDMQAQINSLSTTISSTQQDLNTQIQDLKASASSDFSSIIEKSIPAVVTIRTDIAQGTGFIIDPDGYVITNSHVLAGGTYAQAITSSQEKKDAELIGWNGDYDIALLKMNGKYNYLPVGNSDEVQVGEKVIAIGNPVGLQFSASEGIVSGTHRQLSSSPGTYIQTDAALNPGNSGGPLINKKGEVIGINNFKIGGYESLGFALESNEVKNVVNKISQEKLNKTLIK